MAITNEMLEKSARLNNERKDLEEKIKTFDVRFQNGAFDIRVYDGEGTYARPYKIQIERKNWNENIIIVHENEGYGYKTMITNEVEEFLHNLKWKILDKAKVQFFRIYFR